MAFGTFLVFHVAPSSRVTSLSSLVHTSDSGMRKDRVALKSGSDGIGKWHCASHTCDSSVRKEHYETIQGNRITPTGEAAFLSSLIVSHTATPAFRLCGPPPQRQEAAWPSALGRCCRPSIIYRYFIALYLVEIHHVGMICHFLWSN